MASHVEPYLSRSCGLSGMNGVFNCGGTAKRRTGTKIFTRLPERTPSFPAQTLHIRYLNNDNPASSKNSPGLARSRPLPTKPFMRVRATPRKHTLELSVLLPRILNSKFPPTLRCYFVCRPHSRRTWLTSIIFTKNFIPQDRFFFLVDEGFT